MTLLISLSPETNEQELFNFTEQQLELARQGNAMTVKQLRASLKALKCLGFTSVAYSQLNKLALIAAYIDAMEKALPISEYNSRIALQVR